MNDITEELLIEGGKEISALFLGLASDSLLVPMAAVAEVANDDMTILPLDDADERFYGWVNWRGLQLLLLSFEALSGGRQEALTEESQIVILNAIGAEVERGFYGLHVQGYPQRINILDTEDAPQLAKQSAVPGALYEVVVRGQLALIPDFDYLEALCSGIAAPASAPAPALMMTPENR